MIICCKDCPNRKPACHGSCEEYKRRLEEQKKRLEWLKDESKKTNAVIRGTFDSMRRR